MNDIRDNEQDFRRLSAGPSSHPHPLADFTRYVGREVQALRDGGLYKSERVLTSQQGARVRSIDGRELINLCANNYLGLSSHPAVLDAAAAALRSHGYGLSSVRFICGTQDLHKTLEQRLARYLGTEDAILYAAAFDANGGLFEPLLGEQDAVISDPLNHASVIDGIRLCKARRFHFAHDDMNDLEAQLQSASAAGARFKLVFTDGVFSMDGTAARLDRMRQLCNEYGALLAIDDCHATGFMGVTGRGTHEHRGLMKGGCAGVDMITGTLGKALGGASGGFTAGPREVVQLLRQRSRPYLFSNSLAPMIAGASLAVIDILEASTALRDKLMDNTAYFRGAIAAAGFAIKPGEHPIVPIMVHDAVKAQALAARLQELGVHAVAFFYPVVPHQQARIRVLLSAAYERADLETAVAAFRQAAIDVGVLV